MMQAYFVCGTGTDVGKSVVCAGLLKNMPSGRAIKIVQTGAELFDQNLYAEACPQGRCKTLRHFMFPASPHLAASLENQAISLDALAREVRAEAQRAEPALLEGSGGVMTPLSATDTFLDLMRILGYPVILVVGNVLGAVNHALLSLEALRRAGLDVAGLIFTHPDAGYAENHPVCLDNMEIIKKLGQADVLGVVPRIPELARAADKRDAWSKVAAGLHAAAVRLAWPGAGPGTESGAGTGSEPGAEPGRSAPSAEAIIGFDREHVWHPYSPAPGMGEPNWLVEKTGGNYIWLKNGRKLLDGMSSWWCAIHGYGRPELAAALARQARDMPHVMFGGLTHEPAVELGQKLLPILPPGLEKIFWVDSGSVAVEVALKMAVQYWRGRGFPKKTRMISHHGGYHGDTLGAMSVGDPHGGMHGRFGGFVPEQVFVPRPAAPFHAPFDASCLRAAAETAERHHRECAAVIIEPVVQGAGGMWMYHPEYLKGLKEICRRHELLLIYDEIATGFGRTGKMFAAEWAGESPDILCLGKALTGGTMSLAAAVCTGHVAANISRDGIALMHGPTFMGNPLACRAALASLDLLRASDWEGRVRSIQEALGEGLAACRDMAGVRDVRVLGAIGVVEMNRPVNVPRLRRYFAEQHDVWLRPFNNLIYVMPPYTVTAGECARLSGAVSRAVESEAWV
jgi:adenosylmethionine-8-amino-7-oxononanoate aminotransferase